jgi:hypothetical protein
MPEEPSADTLAEMLVVLQVVCADIEQTLRAIHRVHTSVQMTLQTAIEAQRSAAVAALPPCDIPATLHRREHRSGRTAKLDVDEMLQAFVLARIDRLTYQEIADEIAQHFPVDRRIGKSAIHSWWNRPDVQKTFAGR